MPATTRWDDDYRLARTVPLAHGLLAIFFVLFYGVFDGAQFDDTLTNGVSFDELDSFPGIMANVFAQAVWLNVVMVGAHTLCPAVPTSAAAIWAHGFMKYKDTFPSLYSMRGVLMDGMGLFVSAILCLVGFFQSFFDDQNGIGIYVLWTFSSLALNCIQRLLQAKAGQESTRAQNEYHVGTHHLLWSRPCYHMEDSGIPQAQPPPSGSQDDHGGDDEVSGIQTEMT